MKIRYYLFLTALYLLIASVCTFIWMAYERAPQRLSISFLDIGQGDSIFIQSPTGRQVLIDGGIDRRVLGKLSRAMPLFDRSIDVIINTHPDKDHLGGIPFVLSRYRVENILDPGVESEGETYAFYRDELAREVTGGASYREVRRGDVVDLGAGAYIRILFPDRDMDGVSDDNNASVVAQLVYGDTEAMLTGDAPKSVEDYVVMLDGETLASDILKAGHHGSRTSSGQPFIDAVDSDYAIISAGCDNTYGHPHEEVIERFEMASTTILSTCEEGTIVFTSDGKSFTRQ